MDGNRREIKVGMRPVSFLSLGEMCNDLSGNDQFSDCYVFLKIIPAYLRDQFWLSILSMARVSRVLGMYVKGQRND